MSGWPDAARISRLIETIVDQVNERFDSVKKAFRFFDQNSRMQISYEDFIAALENLEIDLSMQDSLAVF